MTSRKPVNKLLACIMAVMIALAYMPAAAQYAFALDLPDKGDGTEDNPYKIENAEDLINLADKVNSGTLETEGKYFEVTEDIELNPVESQEKEPQGGLSKKEEQEVIWQAIGTDDYPFAGYFDGKGHAILGLNGEQGLFGYVRAAEIENVVVFGNVTAEGVDGV